jgi:hypothetical protein
VTEITVGKGLSMTERSGGYRGLARGLAVAVTLGTVLTAMTSCGVGGSTMTRGTFGPPTPKPPVTTAPPTAVPTALPQASCGEAGTHELSGATQFFRADKGALSCFATAVRQCQSASIAITEMGVDTGTKYVFAVVPGNSRCQATEFSQRYSANVGGSQKFKIAVTPCSAAAGSAGVKLDCGRQNLLIPTTVTNP